MRKIRIAGPLMTPTNIMVPDDARTPLQVVPGFAIESAEQPECRCDRRQLAATGHDPDCPWMLARKESRS